MKISKMTYCKSVLLIGFLSTAVSLHAEETTAFNYASASTNYVDNTSTGNGGFMGNPYYLGGTMGQSSATTYCNGASACEDSDSAWKVFGGYKLADKLSVEGAYMNIGDIRKSGQTSDVSAFAAYGVGTLPVTERFDVFAKLGGARWKSDNTDGSQSGFSMAYGVGAKMSLNETTKLRAEWEKVLDVETSNSEESDINVLSVGVELSTL